VFNSVKALADDKIMAIDPEGKGAEMEIDVPNPNDRQNVLTALRGFSSEGLDDRYLVFLAANHPYRAVIFNPITDNVIPIGSFSDKVPPRANRYVYRLRAGYPSGLIAEGDAILGLIVRVPALKPGPVPELIGRSSAGSSNTLMLEVRPSDVATHVVVFYDDQPGMSLKSASLTRVRNRRDLFPHGILHLRTAENRYAKQVVKPLDEGDVVVDDRGNRKIVVQLPDLDVHVITTWACTLTSDGIPSAPGGAWTVHLPQTV
jgi:hypothetical protein